MRGDGRAWETRKEHGYGRCIIQLRLVIRGLPHEQKSPANALMAAVWDGRAPSAGPATWHQWISMSFGMGVISFGMRISFNPLVFHKIQHEKSIQSITASFDLAWEIIRFKPCRLAWQVTCTVVAMKLYHQLLRMSMKGMSSSYLAWISFEKHIKGHEKLEGGKHETYLHEWPRWGIQEAWETCASMRRIQIG